MKRTTAGLLSYEFGKFRFFMNANDFAMLRRFSCVRSLNHRPLISRRQRYRPRVAKAEWLSSRVPLNFDRAAGTAAQRIGPRAERPIFFKFNEPNETPQILRRERRRKKERNTNVDPRGVAVLASRKMQGEEIVWNFVGKRGSNVLNATMKRFYSIYAHRVVTEQL